MFWIVALLLAAQDTVSPVGPAFEWIRKPTRERMVHCARRYAPDGAYAKVLLQCTSAPADRAANCEVIESSDPGDPGIAAAATCASKFFRIRTRNAAGEIITGETVRIPVTMEVGPSPWTASDETSVTRRP